MRDDSSRDVSQTVDRMIADRERERMAPAVETSRELDKGVRWLGGQLDPRNTEPYQIVSRFRRKRGTHRLRLMRNRSR
jgi:hypothetical protein